MELKDVGQGRYYGGAGYIFYVELHHYLAPGLIECQDWFWSVTQNKWLQNKPYTAPRSLQTCLTAELTSLPTGVPWCPADPSHTAPAAAPVAARVLKIKDLQEGKYYYSAKTGQDFFIETLSLAHVKHHTGADLYVYHSWVHDQRAGWRDLRVTPMLGDDDTGFYGPPTDIPAATPDLCPAQKLSVTFAVGVTKIRCECGVEKCGGGIHSNWCPKHKTP